MPMSPRLLRPRAAVSTAFDPRSIGTMSGWWDAADSSTITLVNGFVSQWNDKSGNSLHVSQGTEAARPSVGTVNGLSALYFDGSNDWLNRAGVSPAGTVILAVRPNRTGNETYFYNGVTTPAINVFAIGTGANNAVGCERRTASGFSYRQSSLGVTAGATNIYSATVFSEPPGLLRVNGTTGSTVASASFAIVGNAAALAFGGASSNGVLVRPFQGHICEALFYSAELATSAISIAERYLAAKWGITLYSPPAYADADVNAYIAAVETADGGVALETGVRDAINTFITGCKADGIWTAIKASCLLMGARTLSGALTPLVGAAPTNNNFVSGDYNRKTGLLGNGTSKYLDSNRNANADPQNSVHLAVAFGQTSTIDGIAAGAGFNLTGATRLGPLPAAGGATVRVRSSSLQSMSPTPSLPTVGTLFAVARSSSSLTTLRSAGAESTNTGASQTPYNGNYFVLADNNAGSATAFINGRIAFYSIGESLTLSSLDSRVSTLYTAIGAAIP